MGAAKDQLCLLCSFPRYSILFFSLQLDTSTDVTNIVVLLVVVRFRSDSSLDKDTLFL